MFEELVPSWLVPISNWRHLEAHSGGVVGHVLDKHWSRKLTANHVTCGYWQPNIYIYNIPLNIEQLLCPILLANFSGVAVVPSFTPSQQ